PERVQAPTLDGAIVEQRTRMETTGGQVPNDAPGAEIDRREVRPHRTWRSSRVGVAQPELTLHVFPPALDRVVVEDRARVSLTGGHDLGGATRTEIDGGKIRAISPGLSHRAAARDGTREAASGREERADPRCGQVRSIDGCVAGVAGILRWDGAAVA